MQRRNEQGTAVILRPVGRIDADTCWELRQELADAFAGGFRSVIVDLSRVEAMDVTALQVLVGARSFLLDRGGVLLVTSVCPEILSVMRQNDLTDLMEVPASPGLAEELRPVTRLRAGRSNRPVTASGTGSRPVTALVPKASSSA